MPMLGGLAIQQVAYFVPDIEAAARAHSAQFGSGPYFIFRHVPLASSLHRGVEQRFDHSSAYGQWGDVMVEFVQQHGREPSAMHDLFPAGSGRYGLHHMAVFVDSLDAAIASFEEQGFPLAQVSQTESGMRFAFMDGSQNGSGGPGHMIEIYEPADTLTGFYAMVRDAAKDWDGQEVLRELG